MGGNPVHIFNCLFTITLFLGSESLVLGSIPAEYDYSIYSAVVSKFDVGLEIVANHYELA